MDVSKIGLFGNTLNIKDSVSREATDALSEKVEKNTGALVYSAQNLGLTGDAEHDVPIVQNICDKGNVIFDFSNFGSVNLDKLIVRKENVTFKNAKISGQLQIDAPAPNNDRLDACFYDCVFTGFIPVTIYMGVGIHFSRCKFINSDIAIKITAKGEYPVGTYSHIVEELVVTECTFEFPRIALYSEKGTMTGVLYPYMYVGDIIFSSNTIKVAKETHVSLATLDGGVISNNIMFHYGATSLWKDKKYCVEIREWSGGCKIIGNSMFESGLETIKMFNSTDFVISNNVIIQPGQVNLKSAILIYNYGEPQIYLSARGVINNNVIFTPTKFCIEFENIKDVVCNGNFFKNGGDYSFYYGENFGNPPVNTVTHYGVSSVNQNGERLSNIFVTSAAEYPDILYTGVSYSGDFTRQYKTVKTVNDFTGGQQFNVAFDSPTSVVFDNLPAPVNGAIISITAYNGNCTIKNSNNLRLKDGSDYVMENPSNIVLQAYNSSWWEISRTKYSA